MPRLNDVFLSPDEPPVRVFIGGSAKVVLQSNEVGTTPIKLSAAGEWDLSVVFNSETNAWSHRFERVS